MLIELLVVLANAIGMNISMETIETLKLTDEQMRTIVTKVVDTLNHLWTRVSELSQEIDSLEDTIKMKDAEINALSKRHEHLYEAKVQADKDHQDSIRFIQEQRNNQHESTLFLARKLFNENPYTVLASIRPIVLEGCVLNKIEFIKNVRSFIDCGLKNAKDIVETYEAKGDINSLIIFFN